MTKGFQETSIRKNEEESRQSAFRAEREECFRFERDPSPLQLFGMMFLNVLEGLNLTAILLLLYFPINLNWQNEHLSNKYIHAEKNRVTTIYNSHFL